MERIHATSVVIDGHAVLLAGEPGSGKSDLALRLIDAGAVLLADDYTELNAQDGQDGQLIASAPDNIRGLLEVRGIGIVNQRCHDAAPVAAVFELKPLSDIERLPDPADTLLDGVSVPRFALHAFDASAPAKVRLALKALSENLFYHS